jgi:release factor glutamine methyltransferase
MLLRDFLDNATGKLTGLSPSARLDAEVLAMHVLGLVRAELIIRANQPLAGELLSRLDSLVSRRVRGEPVAYLTGEREFWSLPLKVTPATLIPRPETELLVEHALQQIPNDAVWRVADLGTGSGAIALAVARERPRCHVLATDICDSALAVARENAAQHGIGNVEFRHGSWLNPCVGETFDLIVSNPPYVREKDPHLAQGDVRHEPRRALVAGHDGLDAIRAIAAAARRHLKPGSHLMFEHGFAQAAAVRALLRWYGYRDNTSHRDLAGHERLTVGRTVG